MLSGFPNRPQRIAFGPNMENVRAPKIPNKDLAADPINLTFWQTAGAGRTTPMAVILFDGVTPTILFQALAFDPRQELDNLAFVKNGTGDYTFTFASTYNDERGTAVSYVPLFGISGVQDAVIGDKTNVDMPGGQDVRVVFRDNAEAVKDGTFMLAVW